MNDLDTALLGLTSPDPIKFDNSYDALLLDDDERLNLNQLIQETNHNVPALTKTLLQILCLPLNQKTKRWCQRLQGTIIFGRYLNLLLDNRRNQS